jgi:plastocyanin
MSEPGGSWDACWRSELLPRLGLVLLSIIATACGEESSESGRPSTAAGPYVVTAIDYHFHDAHPSLPIAPGRALQFSNQGSNVHNVTIPGTGFDRNIRPGQRITVARIGSLLPEPGRHPFFCALHADRAMKGVLVVA